MIPLFAMATPYDNAIPGKITYKKYIEYLLNSKHIISLDNIKETLNKNDEYITFNEALLKVFYNYYYEGKIKKEDHKLIELILKSNIKKIENSLEGFLLENILLSENKYQKINSIYSCLYLNIDKVPCLENKLFISKQKKDYIKMEQIKLILNE